jgi:ribonuclease J
MKNELKLDNKVEVIPLGGVEEIGINCTAIRHGDSIIVIDAGLGFSDVDHLGVDYLIPNYDYLVQNKEKIDGIFITHGHLDHIGAISHFVKELGNPDVFAPAFAMELIKTRLDEAKLLKGAKLHVVSESSVLDNGQLKVEYFRVNHSIPDSYGIVVRTPVGSIVHSGDFKFDNSPLNEPKADYLKMAKLGEEGVRLLLSDSTNSQRAGHSISELEIMKTLSEAVEHSPGRVIVATFASLVTRLYALVEIAKKQGRKIYITGRSMQNSIDIARRLGYIDARDELFVDSKSLNRFSDQRIMILATGSQGEHMAALSRMSRGEHRDVKLKAGDTVIMSSSIIPGNDLLVQNLVDELSRLGVKIFNNDVMNLHTSGHGFIEDQKLMLNLIQPQLFMPVHGYQYFLTRHGETAKQTGVQERNIIISRRGEIIEIYKDGWRRGARVKHHPLLVSGLGVGDVGPLVLQDREKLAANGVLVITLIVKESRQGKELYREPSVYSRGFVYVRDNQELLDKIVTETGKTFERYKREREQFVPKLRMELERHISGMVYNLTKREPLIISNIEIINLPGGRPSKPVKPQQVQPVQATQLP